MLFTARPLPVILFSVRQLEILSQDGELPSMLIAGKNALTQYRGVQSPRGADYMLAD